MMTETSGVLISFAPETSLPSPWSWPQARVPVHHLDFPLSSVPGHLRLTWFLYPGWRAGQGSGGEGGVWGRGAKITGKVGGAPVSTILSNHTTRTLATLEATWEQSPGGDP